MGYERLCIPFTNEAAWLRDRAADLTSTDAAALCNVSRWKSRYQLWHEKRGAPNTIEENAAMRLGKRLEGPIAEHIAAEHGFEVEPFKNYMRMPELRMGSSFDYIARDRSFLFEIKLVGPDAFRRGWVETDYGLEAPVEIEAQVQQEMLVAEIPTVYIGVMSGTETYLLKRDFDQAVADRLVAEATLFWAEPEPEPDFRVDSQFVSKLMRYAEPGKVIDADADLTQLMAEYAEHGRQKREAEALQDEAKAKILLRIGDAERVNSEIGTLSAGIVKGARIEYDRKEYRTFKLSERKKK